MSELPEGWVTCLTGDVAEVVGGGTPKTSESDNFTGKEGFAWLTPADLSGFKGIYVSSGKRHLSEKGLKRSSAVILPVGTVLFTSRAPIGYVAITSSELATNQGFKSFVCSEAIVPEYLYFYLRFAKPLAEELASGTTFLEISGKNAAKIPVRLPPLNEQRRIVAKLEKLLSIVDAAQARLAKIPLILKRFRQSVLAAACSGRLTADWRQENKNVESAGLLLTDNSNLAEKKKRAGRLWGAGTVPELSEEEKELVPQTWIWTKVKSLGEEINDTVQVGPMSMQSKEFRSEGVPVLNVGCVQWGWFDESKLDFLPMEKALAFRRYRIATNDILFTRSGTVGRCAVAGPKQDGYLMTFHLLRVRPAKRKCLSQYLQFVFQGATHIQRQTSEAAIGSTRAGFNTNLLANLDVPLPPLAEQQEIVRRVEALFKTANALEARYYKAKAHIEKLTQSILARAFRGELVPQDPNDEPASVLLERIRRERLAEPKKSQRRTRSSIPKLLSS